MFENIVYILIVLVMFGLSSSLVFIVTNNDKKNDKKEMEKLIKKLNEAEKDETIPFEKVKEEINKMIELNDVISDIKVEKIIDKKYEEMTVSELKEMAKIYNLSGYSSMNKSQLIDILKNTHPQ
jgi:hypothetical protein